MIKSNIAFLSQRVFLFVFLFLLFLILLSREILTEKLSLDPLAFDDCFHSALRCPWTQAVVLPHNPFASSSPTPGRVWPSGSSPRGRGCLGEKEEDPALYFPSRPPAARGAPGRWAEGVGGFLLSCGLVASSWGLPEESGVGLWKEVLGIPLR